jgi:ABC-type antimicrobial peptide transport system permease subunit
VQHEKIVLWNDKALYKLRCEIVVTDTTIGSTVAVSYQKLNLTYPLFLAVAIAIMALIIGGLWAMLYAIPIAVLCYVIFAIPYKLNKKELEDYVLKTIAA